MINFNKVDYINKILDKKLSKIMYYDTLLLCSNSNINFLNKLIKLFFKIDTRLLEKGKDSQRIIASFPYQRKDHEELFDLAIKGLNSFVIKSFKKKINFNTNLFRHYNRLKKILKSQNLTLKEKIFLFGNAVYYLNSLDELNKIEFKNHNKILLFNSSVREEALISVAFTDKSNVTTYSMTHGQTYVNYKIFKPIDIVNAININSKYIIVWGNNQKRELIENYLFDSKKIIVGGNPKYIINHHNNKKKTNNIGLVLLPRKQYLKSNLYLLDLLKKIKQKFVVLPHPSSNCSDYKKYYKYFDFQIKKKLSEIIKEYNPSFCITFNSSVYYEILNYNIPCFRFSKFENDTYRGLDDSFDNLNRLKLLIKNSDRFIEKNEKKLNEVLKNSLGAGINNYYKILKL